MAGRAESGRGDDSPLEKLIDDAAEAAGEDGELTVQNLLDKYGTRGFGPIIAILALLVLTVGAIPFLPMAIAFVILLISGQLIFGKKSPWIPQAFRERGIKQKRVEKARETLRPWLQRIDGFIRPRLAWAAGDAAQWLAAVCIFALALAVGFPPLEAIPFAVDIPALPILILAVGLTARDGLLMLIGFAASAAAGYAVSALLSQSSDSGESASLLISMVA